MANLRQFARNVTTNWLALAANIVVPFFLTPFIVHHLGDVAYGLWILIVATVGYMSLMDMGLRAAIIRFVSQSVARGEHDESKRVVSAALQMRCLIGGIVLLVGIGLALLFPRFFAVPHDLLRSAQWAVIVTSVNLALTLILDVYGAVLAALHRFDVISYWTIAQLLLRAGGLVWLLLAGHGILALAVWELATTLIAKLGILLQTLRVYPQLLLPIERRAGTLRKIWGYSFWVFVNSIACQLVYATDNLVVGAMVAPAAVTFYTIGSSLLSYSGQVVSSVTTTFTPIASGLDAEGKLGQLRRLLIQGTTLSLALILPTTLALFFRGGTFIRLWMGAHYAVVSETVLRILFINIVLTAATVTASQICYGMGRHKTQAIWAAITGAANLALSIGLAAAWAPRGLAWGDYAVAWGTAVPALAMNLVFWPIYVRKVLGVRVRDFVWHAWLRIALASIPYAIACWWTERIWPAHNLVYFFLQIAVVLPAYILPVAAMFWKDAAPLLRDRLKWWPRAAESANA